MKIDKNILKVNLEIGKKIEKQRGESMTIEESLFEIRNEIEQAITTACFNGEEKENGLEAKKALICSSVPINYLHEYIKKEFVTHGVNDQYVYPPIGARKPELKLTGFLKQKKQDVAIKPVHITPTKQQVTWGPLAFEKKYDQFGPNLTQEILSVNVRSQLSSLGKNADTLFERTYAESTNLHEIHKKMVLGEVFLIPTHEYDDERMKQNQIGFKEIRVNLEKYISFFSEITGRQSEADSGFKYERCALLIVDFRSNVPKLYTSTEELKKDGLLAADFPIDLRPLDLANFVPDLLRIYQARFDLHNLV